tara:strand:+ start:963 stop:1316 length:354 start_codon:yes stop_codon:yes gene_type:complete
LIISVYDGDTFRARVNVWPGIIIDVSVRVRGVDTPEIKGKCKAEIEKAIKARDYARVWLNSAVFLKNVSLGKYAGRVIADVYDQSGNQLSSDIISNGLGRKYNGGRRMSWCKTIPKH